MCAFQCQKEIRSLGIVITCPRVKYGHFAITTRLYKVENADFQDNVCYSCLFISYLFVLTPDYPCFWGDNGESPESLLCERVSVPA